MNLTASHTCNNPQSLLLTYQEVAHLLGVSPKTIWTMVHRRGQLPSVKFGNLCRVPRAAVDEFISQQSQTVQPVAESA